MKNCLITWQAKATTTLTAAYSASRTMFPVAMFIASVILPGVTQGMDIPPQYGPCFSNDSVRVLKGLGMVEVSTG